MNSVLKFISKYSELCFMLLGVVQVYVLLKCNFSRDVAAYLYSVAFVFGAGTAQLATSRFFMADAAFKLGALSLLPIGFAFGFLAFYKVAALLPPTFFALGFLISVYLTTRRKSQLAFYGLMCAAIVGNIIWVNTGGGSIRKLQNPVSFKAIAQDARLENMADSSLYTINFNGKITVVDFWATWCGPCINQFEYLSEIQDKFAGDSTLKIVTINTSYNKDTKAKVRNFISKRNFPLQVLYDSAGVFSQKMEVNLLPTTLLVDQHGQVVYRFEGYDRGLDLMKVIRQMRAGIRPEVAAVQDPK